MAATSVSAQRQVGAPWWVLLVKGIAMVIFGLLLLVNPLVTAVGIIIYIGLSWFISGVMDLVGLLWDRSDLVWTVLSGILGIWAGLAVLGQPLLSTILLPTIYVLILGITGIFFGGVQLYQSVRGAGWGAAALGIANIILGILLAMNPLAGAIVLPFIFGIFAIAGGLGAIIAAFRAR